MKLSVVTINYNNAGGLKKTIDSVAAQTYNGFEHIIVDGNSHDEGVRIIQEYDYAQRSSGEKHPILRWTSETDKGIYNAMNKGVRMAQGEYVLMLNSGDTLVDEHVLEHIIPELDGTDIVQGNTIEEHDGKKVQNKGYGRSEITMNDIMQGKFLHQASFSRRDLFERYGYFDEIPAAYVLKYLDFQTCMNFVKINLWTWKEGTQYIWEQLNDHLKNPARLNSTIEKVERRDGKVYVTVNGEVEEYDKIIVTAPLYIPNKRTDGQVGMVDYFDAREDEKELFSKIDYERYDVLAVETTEKHHPEISYYVFDNMVPERLGHLMVYYRRWRDTKDQVITTYALRKHKDMEEVPYDVCKTRVLKDLWTMKNPAKKLVNEWSVYYFPHVFSEDYAAGWYDKVEAMQDKYDTFYAGEIMSFGDMDETAEYSRELVERFF